MYPYTLPQTYDEINLNLLNDIILHITSGNAGQILLSICSFNSFVHKKVTFISFEKSDSKKYFVEINIPTFLLKDKQNFKTKLNQYYETYFKEKITICDVIKLDGYEYALIIETQALVKCIQREVLRQQHSKSPSKLAGTLTIQSIYAQASAAIPQSQPHEELIAKFYQLIPSKKISLPEWIAQSFLPPSFQDNCQEYFAEAELNLWNFDTISLYYPHLPKPQLNELQQNLSNYMPNVTIEKDKNQLTSLLIIPINSLKLLIANKLNKASKNNFNY